MKASITVDYSSRRAAEYPSIADQLDAIFKGFKAMADAGTALPADITSMVTILQAIKAKYPKVPK